VVDGGLLLAMREDTRVLEVPETERGTAPAATASPHRS
jgi:hypothetical protein